MRSPCPLCRVDAEEHFSDGHWRQLECDHCGTFAYFSGIGQMPAFSGLPDSKSRVALARLRYAIWNKQGVDLDSRGVPSVSFKTLQDAEDGKLPLPLPPQQARDLLRSIGNHQRETGEPFTTPLSLSSRLGIVADDGLDELVKLLETQGLLNPDNYSTAYGGTGGLRLSLPGWAEWEETNRGHRAGRNGFIAMEFGDERLDRFVEEVVKQGVKDALGIDVHRVDDRPEAGLIDNIMRRHIQDAAFVIVDLSHGNKGAYWEAGYAEGLGKPVIYICERCVFEDAKHPSKPHFDVNHSTTVFWEAEKPEAFIQKLVATILNSVPTLRVPA